MIQFPLNIITGCNLFRYRVLILIIFFAYFRDQTQSSTHAQTV